MLKQKERRWDYLTMDQVREMARNTTSESVWNDDLKHPMLVTSDAFVGKQLRFTYDDGTVMDYKFTDNRHLFWSVNGGERHADVYNMSPAPGYDKVFYLHHYKAGLELPQCSDIVFDLETGYVTAIEAKLGNPRCPREATHDILFGCIDGVPVPSDAIKPEFTTELVGKAIQWRHPGSSTGGIKYIFLSPLYYTYSMRYSREESCFMATNPANFIKIKNGLYLMTIIEERQTGVQLIQLMNLNIMRDCQTGFGIGGPTEQANRLETWMRSNREGAYTTMETIY